MATETLRPNAAGDETNLVVSGAENNWEAVDEETPDDIITSVYTNSSSYQRDLYNLPASSGSGTINFIKIYFRCVESAAQATGKAKPSLKSDTTVTDGTEVDLSTTWTTYNEQWNTNPADGQAWEWSDIDALQIGVSLKRAGYKGYAYCTQVYVEVDYTAGATEKTGSDSGSGVDAKASNNPAVTLSKAESGSGVEAIFGRNLTIPEAGIASDTISLLASLAKSDSGSGIDALIALAQAFAASDSGSGIDALRNRLFALPDTGSGIEAIWGRDLALTETGAGIDITSSLLRLLSDTVIGTDTKISLALLLSKSDSGAGTEVSTLLAELLRTDTGAGVDAFIAMAKAVIGSDSGVGVDTALLAIIYAFLTEDKKISEEAAKVLSEYDAKIIEEHRNKLIQEINNKFAEKYRS